DRIAPDSSSLRRLRREHAGPGRRLGPVTQRARQLLRGGVVPRTSQKRISPVRRWVRRSKLTRTTLPRGRAAFEGAEHVRHTVIHWNSHTTTIFLGYGMFQFATTAGFPTTRASVCFSGAATQDGMPSRGFATPDGTNASPQTRSTRSISEACVPESQPEG